MQHAQHHVGHRRGVGGPDVQAALELSAGVPGQEQRAALVVVHVRVAHRRPVEHQRVVEQAALAVGGVLQLVQEIRQHADVVGVDLLEVADPVLAVLVMRGRVERGLHAAVGEHAVRGVAAQLEGEHPRDVAGEGDRLQVEHQLDVLFEGVGHADRRARERPLVAAPVERLGRLDAPFDLADVLEVVGEPGLVGGAELLLEPGHVGGDPVEDALVLGAALGAGPRRGADAEQLIEGDARVADHRHADRPATPS